MEKPIRLTSEQMARLSPMPGTVVVQINGRPGLPDTPIIIAGQQRRSTAEASNEGTIAAAGAGVTFPVGLRVFYKRARQGIEPGQNFDGPDGRYISITPDHISMTQDEDGTLRPFGDRALVQQHGPASILALPSSCMEQYSGVSKVLALSDDFRERVSVDDVVVHDPCAGEMLAVGGVSYRLLKSSEIGGVMAGV